MRKCVGYTKKNDEIIEFHSMSYYKNIIVQNYTEGSTDLILPDGSRFSDTDMFLSGQESTVYCDFCQIF